MGNSSERGIGNPEHDGSYRIVNCIDGLPPHITPEVAMEALVSNPQEIFPFPIEGADGIDKIEVGRTLNLRPVFLDEEPVRVTQVTPTSFTFVGDNDHLRGEGAVLTFTTFQNEDNEICLEQTATFKENFMTAILDLGSHIMWKIQTMRLENVLRERHSPQSGN